MVFKELKTHDWFKFDETLYFVVERAPYGDAEFNAMSAEGDAWLFDGTEEVETVV